MGTLLISLNKYGEYNISYSISKENNNTLILMQVNEFIVELLY